MKGCSKGIPNNFKCSLLSSAKSLRISCLASSVNSILPMRASAPSNTNFLELVGGGISILRLSIPQR